ncbi:39S ribosomal protein L38, mitochondrial [Hypsibius exemplaris]|uniref:Large ribosomal subunit protein mL38 n=1 Tax=Hypsibius exemplaris TaxID=2072580 RepID=A0A1W0X7Q6_HYPEX|nr:39S ribosomal protein L38, mitochondrial [Hypsibius exemplaris]
MAVTFRSLLLKSRLSWQPPVIHRAKHVGLGRIRYGWDLIGWREPEILPSFEQRVGEQTHQDPEVNRFINIGFSSGKSRRELRQAEKEQAAILKDVRKDPALEKAARHHKLNIPLNDVRKQWESQGELSQISGAAMHYGIFRDLYGAAYFVPQFPLRVSFPSTADYETPVYRGNLISPSDALTAPTITFPSADDSLWTLLMTNLDGHLQDTDAEYVHWFIGNIPGGDVIKGETIVDYLQPIPLRGTGFHRYCFVLYHQSKRMDFSDFKPNSKSLRSRTFRTPEFYRGFQDELTPASMAFFLAEWDDSVTKCFHKTLDQSEPAFSYEHKPIYHTPQRKYPQTQPFNLYLDRYRDKKDIAEEMMKKRFKTMSPFTADPPRRKWPLLDRTYEGKHIKDMPSWKQIEIRKEQLGHSRYKLIYDPLASWPN